VADLRLRIEIGRALGRGRRGACAING